jgi:hypothetical protein
VRSASERLLGQLDRRVVDQQRRTAANLGWRSCSNHQSWSAAVADSLPSHLSVIEVLAIPNHPKIPSYH